MFGGDANVRDLERRVKSLESQMSDMSGSLKTLKEIILKMQAEKSALEKETSRLEENLASLMNKQKILIKKKLPVERKLENEVKEKFIEPLKEEMKDNIRIIKKAVQEDISMPGTVETPIDELYEAVTNKGRITMEDAAKKFNVHASRIEEWAKILEEHGLIEIHYPALGKPELRKKV